MVSSRNSTAAAATLLRVALAASVLLLWLSFFRLESVPASVKFACLTFTALAAIRPREGLLLTAGLAPLGRALELFGDSWQRGSEILVLLFLCGWIAGAIIRRERLFDDEGLRPPALLLGAVTVASVAVTTLTTPQFVAMPGGAFVRQYVALVASTYLGAPNGLLRPLYEGARVLEGLLLMAAAITLSRPERVLGDRLARAVLWGAVGMGVLSGVALGIHLLGNEGIDSNVWDFWTGRIAFPVRDANAAGSYFVMAAIAMIGWIGADRSWRLLWIVAATPVLTGLWLSGSRTAVLAGVVMGAGALVSSVAHGRIGWRRVAMPAAIAVLLLSLALPLFRGGFVDQLGPSAMSRVWFARMSWAMWQTAPVFGMGIGEYYPRSTAFMPAELRSNYAMENAHNYYAQMGVELGAIGLACFLVLLGVTGRQVWRLVVASGYGRRQIALAAGLGAFLVTSLVGQPLLVPSVSYAFWLLFGAALSGVGGATEGAVPAAAGPAGSSRSRARVPGGLVGVVAAALVMLTIPVRVRDGINEQDLSTASYGFSSRAVDAATGNQYCWIGPEARFFVHAGAQVVEFPLSGSADRAATDVEVRLDGALVNRIRVDGSSWLAIRIPVSAAAARGRFRLVGLRVVPARQIDGPLAEGVQPTEPRVRIGAVVSTPPHRPEVR
jgi:O-antigen ligase